MPQSKVSVPISRTAGWCSSRLRTLTLKDDGKIFRLYQAAATLALAFGSVFFSHRFPLMATIHALIHDLKVESAIHAYTCDLCGVSITLGEKHLVCSDSAARTHACRSCASEFVAQVAAHLQEIERELAARLN